MDQSTKHDKRSSKHLHPVQHYFDYDEVTNRSTCKVTACTYSVPGRHSNNLTKHIKRHHDKLFDRELSSELNVYENERKKIEYRRRKPIVLP